MRSGESAADVASSTGWDLAKVLRYAEPLLDERAFMAQQARSVEIRRSGGGATLEEACAENVGAAAAEEIVWDSYRREDGRWIITADVPGRGSATWTYDYHGRNLHPVDGLARALMGASVPEPVPDVEIDIAEALDLATAVPVVREGTRPHLVAVPAEEEDSAPEPALEPAPEPEAPVRTPEHVAEDVTPIDVPATRYEQETITLPREEATPPASTPARKAKGRKGRTSIPSWDEILFGAGRQED